MAAVILNYVLRSRYRSQEDGERTAEAGEPMSISFNTQRCVSVLTLSQSLLWSGMIELVPPLSASKTPSLQDRYVGRYPNFNFFKMASKMAALCPTFAPMGQNHPSLGSLKRARRALYLQPNLNKKFSNPVPEKPKNPENLTIFNLIWSIYLILISKLLGSTAGVGSNNFQKIFI